MNEKSYRILETFFLNLEKEIEEVTFFFHPDDADADGEMEISYNDNDDYDDALYLPELKNELIEKNLDIYDEAKYHVFKNHLTSKLKELQKKNSFKQQVLYVYSQHIDGDKEVILRIEPQKVRNLFPEPQQYSFDLSMVNHKNAKSKWWKVITPTWQEDRPFQNLELFPVDRNHINIDSWCGERLGNLDIKNIQLISERKISKLWDYEASDLSEIFSDRFCQLLTQMGVINIEYYPVSVTCKATKETSDTFYKLANIVGLVKGIYFYKKSDFNKGIETLIEIDYVFEGVTAKLKANKKLLDNTDEKIIRCKECPQVFIVDNDIKEACEVNSITGIEFEEIDLVD